jgi:hypothetical protein
LTVKELTERVKELEMQMIAQQWLKSKLDGWHRHRG